MFLTESEQEISKAEKSADEKKIMTDPAFVLYLRISILLISLPVFLISFLLILVRIREKGFSFSLPEAFIMLLPFCAAGAGIFFSAYGLVLKSSWKFTELIIDCLSISAAFIIAFVLYTVIRQSQEG